MVTLNCLTVENPTAVALASVVVDDNEQNKCHFPISIAFSTALVKHPRNNIKYFHAVFHIAQEIYLGHPLWEKFIQQLESERNTNAEYEFYHNAVAYYSLKDMQEVFKDIVDGGTILGGHYYFKYVLPTLDKYGFFDLLSKEEAEKVYEHSFDTVSLYLLERFGYPDFHSKREEAEPGLDSISCKELFEYFSKMNEEHGAIFQGTSLPDLYFDLFGESLPSFGNRSTCVERSHAVIKIFLALSERLKVFHD